ncbi:NAD-dependent epimerase/dehydratase family protein [Thalassovita mediterranea]|jgi:nucleoside-diphosphate-sugar epimerase|uniref:Thioester reductase domain protein n=1 Tax=Thalassovita mediterranea TaxID=340021 RepID=A0A0P1H258_9RHOB|nr:NAD(P)-dependent oxidoreductase [Thalassovita mediterranea]CUH84366.1 thioester reductase domain protein [Thalassovita mediterranea]SIS31935.1 Nucleoside-diphosphate-sugar epimerase [Thalassovita mediterranea]
MNAGEAGTKLHLLITGATGGLGREVVRQCLLAGHQLSVILRDPALCPMEWQIDQRITVIKSDLNKVTTLPQVDVLLHLAASMSGCAAVQQKDTVEATQTLMQAVMRSDAPPAIVLAGSMSVYSAMQLSAGDVVDESRALEDQPQLRDAYCQAKLAQEQICRDAAAAMNVPLQILRIGAIWGAGRLWNAHLGVSLGPIFLRLENKGEVPLSHIRHAAQALRLAAEAAARGRSDVINVVDSDLPDRATYLAQHRRTGWPRLVLPFPWQVLAFLARLTGSRLPFGLLKLPTIRYRMLPLRYANTLLTERLEWLPEAGFQALMDEALQEAGDD